MATTSQNIRLLGENEGDKPEAVNAALRDINRELVAILAAVALGGGGGGAGAVVTSTNVLANKVEWTDTGVTLSGTDVLIMEATGAISHNSSDPLYGPESGAAELRAVLVTDGSTPVGDAAGQISYRVQRYFVRQPGRLWLRVRDVGGSGDNRGSFDVALARYEDANKARALLIHRHGQADVDGLLNRLASIEARLNAGGL